MNDLCPPASAGGPVRRCSASLMSPWKDETGITHTPRMEFRMYEDQIEFEEVEIEELDDATEDLIEKLTGG